MNRGPAHSALHDLLLILVLGLMSMLILAALSMRPPAEPTKGPERNAEFLLEMTWPDNAFDDIDMWVLLPSMQVVSFKSKNVESVTLDRDDLGAFADTYHTEQGVQLIRLNKETVAIRAIQPGRYVVNAQVYSVRTQWGGEESKAPLPYPVKVHLRKLNPTVVDLASNSVTVEKIGQQVTVLSFTVTEKGEVIGIDREEQLPFIAIGGVQ